MTQRVMMKPRTLAQVLLLVAGALLDRGSLAQDIGTAGEASPDLGVDFSLSDDDLVRELAARWRTERQAVEKANALTARRARLEELRAGFLRSVSRGLDDAVRGARLVSAAVELDRERRLQHHFDTLLCDCPNEDWTRTLSACWEPCREGQRSAVRKWLDQNCSDEEIVENMIDFSGTDRVIFKPRGWLSILLPYVILGACIAFVAFVFARLRGRAARLRSTEVSGASNAPSSASEEAGQVLPGDAEPDELDERLEEELRKLED